MSSNFQLVELLRLLFPVSTTTVLHNYNQYQHNLYYLPSGNIMQPNLFTSNQLMETCLDHISFFAAF